MGGQWTGPCAELGPQGQQEVGPTAGAQDRGPEPRPAPDRQGPCGMARCPPARPRVPTTALSCTKGTVVQLKSSGGSQPFSPPQCLTAFPGNRRRDA